MYVIGIDYSIQFPAVCISRDLKSFRWAACVNTGITKAHEKFMADISLEYPSLRYVIIPQPSKKGKETSYSGTERAKLLRYSLLIDNIVDIIKFELRNASPNEPVIVAIEGMAYGAQGNALIDIAQSTGMLKKAILDQVLDGRNQSMFIFSPGELKNAIGAKGNAGKYDIFQQFRDHPSIAVGSDLHRAVIKYETELVNDKGLVKSPFADMIDSYLAVLKIHESLKES